MLPESVFCYFLISLTLIFIYRFKPGLAHINIACISLNIDHTEKWFN